jgi:hypothetical protein
MGGFARQPLSHALFHPFVVIVVSGLATLIFVMTMLLLPRFAGEGRFYLLYYHAPIAFAFVTYLFDRAKQARAIQPRRWAIELSVVGLALSRTLMPVPFISGHALFLTYFILTASSRFARWVAVLVMLDVIYVKLVFVQDLTLLGGVVVGLLAALLVRHDAIKANHQLGSLRQE